MSALHDVEKQQKLTALSHESSQILLFTMRWFHGKLCDELALFSRAADGKEAVLDTLVVAFCVVDEELEVAESADWARF